MRPNIFLTGFMGTGKTTVGKKLAELTGMEFYDLDTIIKEVTGLSISEIFKQKGEAWFRQLESSVLAETAGGTNKVLATGGGVVLSPVNRNRMKSSGIVVALTANLETLWNRLKDSSDRPLLEENNPVKTLERLYQQRAALYKDAHFIVVVDGKSPFLIAREIIQLINTKK